MYKKGLRYGNQPYGLSSNRGTVQFISHIIPLRGRCEIAPAERHLDAIIVEWVRIYSIRPDFKRLDIDVRIFRSAYWNMGEAILFALTFLDSVKK